MEKWNTFKYRFITWGLITPYYLRKVVWIIKFNNSYHGGWRGFEKHRPCTLGQEITSKSPI